MSLTPLDFTECKMVYTMKSYTVYSFLDTKLMENKKNRVNFPF